MFRRIFKESEEEQADEDYIVVKLCFHCGRDGEYSEDDNMCRYCGFSF